MPRFFFDVKDGDHSTHDEEGDVYQDKEAARKIALLSLAEIVDSLMPDGNRREITIKMRDETGKEIFVARMSLTAEWLPERSTPSGDAAG